MKTVKWVESNLDLYDSHGEGEGKIMEIARGIVYDYCRG